jgi:hypothetical protein
MTQEAAQPELGGRGGSGGARSRKGCSRFYCGLDLISSMIVEFAAAPIVPLYGGVSPDFDL